MLDWWNALQPLQQLLYIIAVPATLVLLLQTILTLVGLGQGGDMDHDGSLEQDGSLEGGHDLDHGDCGPDCEVSHDADQGAVHDAGQGEGLHLLTLRGIVAFLTLFGWVGIALLDMKVPALLAIPLGLVAGAIAMFLVAILLKVTMEMQQSGNMEVSNALGLIGEVYVPIEQGAKGKITLIMQERFTEMDAICDQPLKTGRKVRVVAVTGDGTLVVAPIT